MWNGPVVAKVTTRKITSVCVLNHANSIVTKNMASTHLSDMENVLQMWRLPVNMLYQPTCAAEKICSRNLEFDRCIKALKIKKHLIRNAT